MQLNSDQFALTGGTAKINLPDVRDGLQMAHDMIWVDKSSSLDFPDPRQALLSKLASMQISELVSIQLRQPKEAPDLVWGFAPPPAMRPGTTPKVQVAAWNYSVFSQSKEKAPRAQGGRLVQQQGQRLRPGEEVQLDAPLQGQLGARALRLRAEHQGVPRPAEVRDHLPPVPRAQRHPGCGRSRGAEDPPQRGDGRRRPGPGRAGGQRRHQGAPVEARFRQSLPRAGAGLFVREGDPPACRASWARSAATGGTTRTSSSCPSCVVFGAFPHLPVHPDAGVQLLRHQPGGEDAEACCA